MATPIRAPRPRVSKRAPCLPDPFISSVSCSRTILGNLNYCCCLSARIRYREPVVSDFVGIAQLLELRRGLATDSGIRRTRYLAGTLSILAQAVGAQSEGAHGGTRQQAQDQRRHAQRDQRAPIERNADGATTKVAPAINAVRRLNRPNNDRNKSRKRGRPERPF